ncbi:hypothetical protein DEDE109153_12260 [Deinococcus deserti]|uniref:DprA winged helix domain-containing protein n=2 Tax=Deinococcus TaxID=1298 RepID=C1D2R4_DEIDV|nr:hypothetical protein [Deinococcus deserti]ACO47703.1 Hypothetical protein Deide_2p00451 [Deinococcus deserti VCD115]
MDGCAVTRPVARAATAMLLDQGHLEIVPQAGTTLYRRPVPIDLTLVPPDLMPRIVQEVAVGPQTVRTLAGRLDTSVAAMQATVRSMHEAGSLSVTMVGATWVCRSA